MWFRATEEAGIGAPATGDGAEDGATHNGSSGPAAVAHLALARPGSVGFDDLHEALGRPDPGALAIELWRAFRAGELELSAAPDRHATVAGERPEASPVARWQAVRGAELTSLSHEPVRLDDPLGRVLIRLCDGTRDRRELVDALVAAVGTDLLLTAKGAPVTDGEQVRGQIAAGLEPNLEILGKLAMLRA